MTPLQQFNTNIKTVDHYLDTYTKLRGVKSLGSRGRSDPRAQYLLWLPRAAIVSSLSSLDGYVRQVLDERLPKILAGEGGPISAQLAELVSRVMSTTKPEETRAALVYVRDAHSVYLLVDLITDSVLRFESYHQPDKIVQAYKLLGIQDILAEIANTWPGPGMTRDTISERLLGYARTRNQIADDGDLDKHKAPPEITLNFARICRDFIRRVTMRLDKF